MRRPDQASSRCVPGRLHSELGSTRSVPREPGALRASCLMAAKRSIPVTAPASRRRLFLFGFSSTLPLAPFCLLDSCLSCGEPRLECTCVGVWKTSESVPSLAISEPVGVVLKQIREIQRPGPWRSSILTASPNVSNVFVLAASWGFFRTYTAYANEAVGLLGYVEPLSKISCIPRRPLDLGNGLSGGQPYSSLLWSSQSCARWWRRRQTRNTWTKLWNSERQHAVGRPSKPVTVSGMLPIMEERVEVMVRSGRLLQEPVR
jgi:hypothetical protein